MKRSYPKFWKRLESLGLHEEITKRARKLSVSVAGLYDGKAPSIHAARKVIYAWLMKDRGMGNNEVARLFDRAPSGVSKLIHADSLKEDAK